MISLGIAVGIFLYQSGIIQKAKDKLFKKAKE
jgi:hypothetical protein